MIAIFPLLLLLASNAALAAAPEEEQMLKAPAPHEQFGASGSKVKVHRSRLHGYVAGKEGNAAALASLQADVKACASGNRGSAYPVNPPKVWPTYRQVHREDVYLAANRSIVYTRDIYYSVRLEDCGLLATEVATARLSSAKGLCEVDLVHKTAKGYCDISGHASAAPPAAPKQSPSAMLKQLEANPATAAMAAQMRAMMAAYSSKRTGQFRQMAGLRCEVWSYATPAMQGSMCHAEGGSFRPLPQEATPDMAGLPLDIDLDVGARASAVDARLDTEVSSSVFTPYKAPGYQLETGPAR